MSSKSSFYNSTGVTNTQSNAIDASVDNAEASAVASENSANNASTSAATATTKASEASTSAATSTTKASEASTSAATATTKASEASTSAATATTKASESATSATASSNSATSASTSASTATTKASEASSSASSALSHKNDAQTAKTAAETAETNAETAETNAASSSTAASTSASSASTSASTATTKATEAATSATSSANSATASANSATAAAASAASITGAETNAANSATAAASSATAASASKDAALAALDNFDDRYLGVKSSNPSVDNDGNALVAGSLYFNSTDDTMKVYEGSTWVAAYASLSGAVLQANNLSDLTSASDARANLGLGTAATTAATAYATAAQGTLATNALPKAGGAMTGNLSLGNNNKAIFGAGSDLQIYHSGSTSFIRDTGNGDLQIFASDDVFIRGQSTNNYMARFAETGAVTLYHNNASKLATTSTGINVTGTAVTDGLTVAGNITAGSSTAGAVTVGSANGFEIQKSGVNGYINQSDSGPIIIRMGSSYSEKIRIDSSGRVGIGESLPLGKLHIKNGDSGATVDVGADELVVENSTHAGITILSGQSYNGSIYFGDTSVNYDGFITYGQGTRSMVFGTAAGTRMTLDSSGNVGIGTSSIAANTKLIVKAATNQNLEVESSSGKLRLSALNDARSANVPLQFTSSSFEFLTGNVGIGTDSPQAELHVHDPAGHAKIRLSGTASSADTFEIYQGITGVTNGGLTIRDVEASADRLVIDSSGRVGIGTSSPSRNLTVSSSDQTDLAIIAASGSSSQLCFGDGDDDNVGQIEYSHPTDSMRLYTQGTERMRLDSSGNLLVGGHTSTHSPVENGGSGVSLLSNGQILAGGEYPSYFNRENSDGDIIVLRKDGSAVGSIGVDSNDNLTISASTANHSGLYMGTNTVIPMSGGAESSGTVSLGNSGTLWKDAYLSGGVYLGGTGSANKLDDYEEGTWTPAIYYQNSDDQTNSTNVTQVGRYRKVGNLVVASFYLVWSTSDSRAADNIGVKNFPFPPKNIDAEFRSPGQLICSDTGLGSSQAGIMIYLPNNNTTAIFSLANTGSGNLGAAFGNNNNMKVRATISYLTN